MPPVMKERRATYRHVKMDALVREVCLSMSEIIPESEAQPLRSELNWAYPDDATANTWDASMIRGCLCDSSWTVGLDAGETQVAEWYGPDCSLRRCPSGDGTF